MTSNRKSIGFSYQLRYQILVDALSATAILHGWSDRLLFKKNFFLFVSTFTSIYMAFYKFYVASDSHCTQRVNYLLKPSRVTMGIHMYLALKTDIVGVTIWNFQVLFEYYCSSEKNREWINIVFRAIVRSKVHILCMSCVYRRGCFTKWHTLIIINYD